MSFVAYECDATNSLKKKYLLLTSCFIYFNLTDYIVGD